MSVGETRVTTLVMAGVAVLLTASALWAHAVVAPAVSTTRTYETYTLRVPNEKDVATVRVDIEFPPEVFVVSFAEVPGWELDVERNGTGRAVGATWSGELAPRRFVELSFVGVNPTEPTTLVWEVDQTYRGPAGEEIVSWSGPADSEFPASRTEVRALDDGTVEDDPGGDVLPSLAALVAMIALVVSIRALRVASAGAEESEISTETTGSA